MVLRSYGLPDLVRSIDIKNFLEKLVLDAVKRLYIMIVFLLNSVLMIKLQASPLETEPFYRAPLGDYF